MKSKPYIQFTTASTALPQIGGCIALATSYSELHITFASAFPTIPPLETVNHKNKNLTTICWKFERRNNVYRINQTQRSLPHHDEWDAHLQ